MVLFQTIETICIGSIAVVLWLRLRLKLSKNSCRRKGKISRILCRLHYLNSVFVREMFVSKVAKQYLERVICKMALEWWLQIVGNLSVPPSLLYVYFDFLPFSFPIGPSSNFASEIVTVFIRKTKSMLYWLVLKAWLR